MITVQVNSRDAEARLAAAFNIARRPGALLAVLGRTARNQLVSHFRAKNRAEPNRLGGKRTNFWNSVARSTHAPVVNESQGLVTISITDPRFAQKLFGGVITAKRAKYLTIPLTPEAYGRRASVFEAETGKSLFFLKTAKGLMLAHATDPSNVTAHYLLKRSVLQKPTPAALPDLGAGSPFLIALADAADKAVQRQLARNP